MTSTHSGDARTVTVQTRTIAWHVRVDGSQPEGILLLHGFTGDHRDWDVVAEQLSLGYTVVRPDLPGHGKTKWRPSMNSSGARRSMTDVALELSELMTALGIERFGCLGYSLGGRTAIAVACTDTLRLTGLVLESASPGLRSADERMARCAADQRLADRILQRGIVSFVDEWERIPLFESQQRLSEVAWARQRAVRLAQSPQGLAASLRAMGTGAQPSYWAQFAQLTMPLLLVTGGADEKFCAIADQMLQCLPSAKHVVIRDAGHNVHLERPELYLSAVADHLKLRSRKQEGEDT